jgi:predicted SprT family Zn-dependent metalloprotease
VKIDEAKEMAEEFIECMGDGGLDGWTVEFTPRLPGTHTLGRADLDRHMIDFSMPFVEKNDQGAVSEVLRHEMAHALWADIPGALSEGPHGKIWKANAKRLGIKPRACFNVELKS